MGLLVGKAEAEKIVLVYLEKQTSVPYKKFNPALLTSVEIAKNTDLDEDVVNETLEALGEGVARVEQTQCNFKFWLPASVEAEKLKNRLFESNMAYSNVALFSFISVVLLFFGLQWIVEKGWLTLTTTDEFFFAGVILTALSISMAKKFTNTYYLWSQKMRRVRHFKVYAWLFVIFTIAMVYLLSAGIEGNPVVQRVLLYSSILANILTVVVFAVNLMKRKNDTNMN